jgi:AcrR family transcriptional regulator
LHFVLIGKKYISGYRRQRIVCEVVQNESNPEAASGLKRRGRPRAYQPDEALLAIIAAFWKTGYSGTSLDDLTTATGMSRPSLYAAFGDKQSIYLKALDHYWEQGVIAMQEALTYDGPLDEGLMLVYQKALAIYFSGEGRPRGCFAIGTATTEAMQDPKIRAALARGLRRLDDGFEAHIRAAQASGELPGHADPATLAMLASATLHTIAIRARSGTERSELEEIARQTVAMICGKRALTA